jgi:hypothetical protein
VQLTIFATRISILLSTIKFLVRKTDHFSICSLSSTMESQPFDHYMRNLPDGDWRSTPRRSPSPANGASATNGLGDKINIREPRHRGRKSFNSVISTASQPHHVERCETSKQSADDLTAQVTHQHGLITPHDQCEDSSEPRSTTPRWTMPDAPTEPRALRTKAADMMPESSSMVDAQNTALEDLGHVQPDRWSSHSPSRPRRRPSATNQQVMETTAESSFNVAPSNQSAPIQSTQLHGRETMVSDKAEFSRHGGAGATRICSHPDRIP